MSFKVINDIELNILLLLLFIFNPILFDFNIILWKFKVLNFYFSNTPNNSQIFKLAQLLFLEIILFKLYFFSYLSFI